MKKTLLVAAALAVAIMGPPAAIAASDARVPIAFERTADTPQAVLAVAPAIASIVLHAPAGGGKQDLQVATAPPADPVRQPVADHRTRVAMRDVYEVAYHLLL